MNGTVLLYSPYRRFSGKLKGMKKPVFWVVAQCSLIEVFRRFRGACCLHPQVDGSTTQKTVIFILAAVRTSNPTHR
jgi:hypothetical protein